MPNRPERHFLFLQGPHGPFFARLAEGLHKAGAHVWRVGFNAGDQAFWRGPNTFIPYLGALDTWPETFSRIVAAKKITDLVLYGDVRPIHALAIEEARRLDLRIHIFEEGYLRPYWVTYERGGSNGYSRLMDLSVDRMSTAIAASDHDMHPPPAVWGDMRQHVFYGALYHWFVLFRNQRYGNFTPHRRVPVWREARLYTQRLLLMPMTALSRAIAQLRIRMGGFPYHLALLQLEHDASFQAHAPFERMEAFLELVIDGFAKGAKPHHHLVFKAHPLEMGRLPLRRIIRTMARERGLAGRVHYVRGGKLARLLDQARSAVTVNSTAAQQALWRGIPLRAFGTAVFVKPEFVSDQPLPAFFANPDRPIAGAYRTYRQFLLKTSQVPGGFYSARGRRQLLREVVDMMLAHHDPYDAVLEHGPVADTRLKIVN